MSETLISPTSTTITHDETAGLQNITATPTPAGDADDNDVLFSSIPGAFSTRLGQLTTTTPIGAAESPGNVVTFSPTGTLGNIALTDENGDPLDGDDSGLDTTDGENILLYTDPNNDNIVLGRAGGPTGDIVFAIYLQETGGTPPTGAKLWTVQYEAIDHGDDGNNFDSAVNLSDKVYVTAFEAQDFSFANAPSGQNLFMAFGTASQALVITGEDPANESAGENVSSGSTVNSGQGGGSTTLGTDGQQIKAQKALVVTFVTGANPDYLAGPGAGNNPGQPLSPTEATEESNIQFTGYVLAQAASFTISQMTPGGNTTAAVELAAYLTADASGDSYIDANPLVQGDTAVNITTGSVEVIRGGVNVVGTAGVSVDYSGSGAVIFGVRDDDVISYETDVDHNRVLIRNDQPVKGSGSNVAFDLGGFKLTEVSGDTDEIGSKIFFEDDGPTVAANATVLFDDDALAGGNPGGTGDDADSANASGTLGHSFGADGAGSVAWLTTGPPTGFSYEKSGDDLLIKQGTTTVLTLTLNTATGAYTATQNAPIAHVAGNDENNQAFTVAYRVTDGDGDFVDGSLGINVDDDTPTVTVNATVLLDDDALTGGNPGGTGDDADSANASGTLGHSFGADGAGSVAWLTTGPPAGFSYEKSGDDLLIKQGTTTVLTLTLNTATGAYTATQNAPIAHVAGNDENNQAFTVAYRVTDGDGDFVDGSLGINVDDDTPTVTVNATVLLDDDALTGGNPGGTGDDADSANASGTLGHSFGADGAGSVAWLTTGPPTGFSYEKSGDDLLIKQGTTTVLTLTLNTATGAYTATQNAPIAHVAGNDENNQAFTVAYRVTDGDGDFVDGSLGINVDDDTPTVAANATVLLDDDALTGGNPGGTGDDADSANASGTLGHSFGADGAGSVAWLTTGAPAGFSYEKSGDDLLVKQGGTTVLTLTLNTATGAYTATQNAPIAHVAGNDENNQAFTVAYRVTDGDGDFVDGSLGINVDDDTPTVATNATVLLDDDALAGGNPGGTGDDPDSANASGTLGHSFGADGAGSVAWLTTGAPAGFSYEKSGDDLLVKQGGTTVLTLTLNTATGAYTATQNAPIAHVAGNDENNQAFTVAYRVTDGDGDFVDGSIDINVDDDTPTVVVNDASGSFSAGAQGTWSDAPGADGFKSLSLTLDSYAIGGGTAVVVDTSLGTVTAPDGNGNYVFTGSITADFTDDGVVNEQTVGFTLTFDPDADTYDLQLDEVPTTVVTFDTTEGTLSAGGPQSVRTLVRGGSEAGNDDIVFFAANATAVRSDGTLPPPYDSILDLVERGEDDLAEAEIEALLPLPNLVDASATLNVSTSGIGYGNNNLNGSVDDEETPAFANTSITSGDQSFVVNPETLVDEVTVYISKTVQGYDPTTEDLYYTVYYEDGSVTGPTKVLASDLTHYANNDATVPQVVKGGSSFTIDGGDKQIDAVQLTMGLGTVKIPIIAFTVEEAFEPQPLELAFTAELFDGDSDSVTDEFSVDLADSTV